MEITDLKFDLQIFIELELKNVCKFASQVSDKFCIHLLWLCQCFEGNFDPIE